jgi:hypothetical protein
MQDAVAPPGATRGGTVDDGTDRTEPTWGMPDAVVGWVVAMVMGQIGYSLVLAVAGISPGSEKADHLSFTLMALTYPPLWIGFFGIPILVARRKGRGVVRDFRLGVKPVDLIGIPIGIAAQVVMVPLVSWPFLKLSGKTFSDLAQNAKDLAERADGTTLGIVLLILIVGIGAPIAEEVFFRGLVLRSIEKRYGTTAGIVGSSVVFGLTHFQALQLPALIAAGAVFALLAVRFGRLGPAIFAHMAFNLVTVVSLVWFS